MDRIRRYAASNVMDNLYFKLKLIAMLTLKLVLKKTNRFFKLAQKFSVTNPPTN